jgi:arylsulfatase A-like enzyme
LRAGKSTLYEGGLREPLIVRYPGVTPAAKVSDASVCLVDFYPTFLEAAGVKPDPKQKLDGESLLAVLKKPASRLKRDTLYWHYPLKTPHFLGGRSSGAILHGDWKLIEFFDDKHVELYNLKSDPQEKTDLSKSEPAKVTELLDLLHKWQKDVGAKFEP